MDGENCVKFRCRYFMSWWMHKGSDRDGDDIDGDGGGDADDDCDTE